MDALKLIALDSEDLEVMSAHLQDAVLKVGDMTFLPREHRFALVANRFDWEGAAEGQNRRRRTGLSFARVMAARVSGLDLTQRETVLNLLAVTFHETASPSGQIDLVFSGGGTVRLEVECLEGQMSDLGPAWQTAACPAHVVAGNGGTETA
jgi:hypothetical protein